MTLQSNGGACPSLVFVLQTWIFVFFAILFSALRSCFEGSSSPAITFSIAGICRVEQSI